MLCGAKYVNQIEKDVLMLAVQNQAINFRMLPC